MTLSTDTTGARIQSGEWKDRPLTIEEMYQLIGPPIQQQNWMARGILGASIMLLAGTVICAERLNNTQKGLSLLASLAGSTAYSIVTSGKQWRLQRDVYNALHNARKELSKQGLIHQTNLELMHQEIEGVNTRISTISVASHPELVAEMMHRYDVPLPQRVQVREVPTAQGLPTVSGAGHVIDLDVQDSAPLYNPAEDIGKDPNSILIIGVPGAGKGITLANIIRWLKHYHPEITIIGVDPKAKPEEEGIWDVCDMIFRKACKTEDPDVVIGWLDAIRERITNEFHNPEKPYFLIVDEALSLNSKAKNATKPMKEAWNRWTDFIVSVAGQGNGDKQYLCFISQAAQASELPFSSGVRSTMRLLALVSSENSGTIQSLLRTDVIPADYKQVEQVEYAMSKAPTNPSGNRVAFFDGKQLEWLPMPILPVFGQNRKGAPVEVTEEEDDQPSANPLESFLELKQQLGRMPTDAELLSLYKTITGQDLNEKGLAYAKEWLSRA